MFAKLKKLNMLQSEQWFIDRIGKRIYRDDDFCSCPNCPRIAKEGFIISDEYHARELYVVQMDWIADGTELNYRDYLHKDT